MWPVSHDLTPPATTETPRPLVRCAVYARVSVANLQPDEFNSLTAQVESCERYIAERAGKGWTLAAPAFTDDGESAKDLERPGLRALIALVEQGAIDVVVVQRLDRLTRSPFDLASALLPLFEAHRVQLVGVAQHIDTSTANGRLSLNLLVSFVEFEREAIGERTRDKLAATRQRGLWQGHGTPLGYGVNFEQRVVVDDREVDLVKEIFRRYASSTSTAEVMDWLARRQIKTKKWVTRDGKQRGGQPMDRITLIRMLQNRMYIGEAMYDGEWHGMVYPPIVDYELWKAVQDKLAERARRKGIPNAQRQKDEFPFLGKLYWHDGRAYTAHQSSASGKKRYRYYLAPATLSEKTEGQAPFNISTDELHQSVIHYLRKQFREPETLLHKLMERAGSDQPLDETQLRKALKQLGQAWGLLTDHVKGHYLSHWIERVTLQSGGAHVEFDVTRLFETLSNIDTSLQAD
jgi:site-specific DNA recombinase